MPLLFSVSHPCHSAPPHTSPTHPLGPSSPFSSSRPFLSHPPSPGSLKSRLPQLKLCGNSGSGQAAAQNSAQQPMTSLNLALVIGYFWAYGGRLKRSPLFLCPSAPSGWLGGIGLWHNAVTEWFMGCLLGREGFVVPEE